MRNRAKQKARRKRFEKMRNYKNNNLPSHFRGLTLTQKIADKLFFKQEKYNVR